VTRCKLQILSRTTFSVKTLFVFATFKTVLTNMTIKIMKLFITSLLLLLSVSVFSQQLSYRSGGVVYNETENKKLSPRSAKSPDFVVTKVYKEVGFVKSVASSRKVVKLCISCNV
jgi:hypothetical protein